MAAHDAVVCNIKDRTGLRASRPRVLFESSWRRTIGSGRGPGDPGSNEEQPTRFQPIGVVRPVPGNFTVRQG